MATKHQFILWAPFKACPDFEARWDAQIDAHMAAATKLLADGIISASFGCPTHTSTLTTPDVHPQN